MAIVDLDIVSREPYDTGPGGGGLVYERIEAVAHYAVDPAEAVNQVIVDIDQAPRGDDGLIHFEGDVTILRPTESDRSARTAMVEVPNRGRRTALSLYNLAPAVLAPTADIDPGDGFLFARGWTVAWCGWQWDVPRSPARMGLDAPIVVDAAGEPVATEVQLRIQLWDPLPSVALTDHHVGTLGGHQPLPTHDIDDPDAVLTVRTGLWGEPEEIPRSRWRFARQAEGEGEGEGEGDDEGGAGAEPVADDRHLWLDGGFEPGRIYDLVYRTRPSRIPGAGLLAVRDLGAFLGSDHDANPCAGQLDQLHVTGQSQCGRFLRTLFHLGLNRPEPAVPGGVGSSRSRVYDGALIHIAGARRGEFNHRGGQPSVQPTPSFGHLFPFADGAQTDPRTGRHAGLLDGLPDGTEGDLALPRIMYTNTSSEYWRGDASLAHTSVADGSDLIPTDPTPFAGTRHYLFASTQHGAGVLPLVDENLVGAKGGNTFNIVDYRPLMRAALVNLAAWAAEGRVPPPSVVPRHGEGTAADRATVLATLDDLLPVTCPDVDRLPVLYPLDLGPEAGGGIGRFPATPAGEAYPCAVSALDGLGNETGGIRLPEVEVPVATHTGWNPRRADAGAPEEILEYVGSTLPLAPTEAARADGDRRPTLDQLYRDEADYRVRVRAAAEALVARHHVLAEDVDVCEEIAVARYRAVHQASGIDLGPRT